MFQTSRVLALIIILGACSGGGGDAPGSPPETSVNAAPVISTTEVSAFVDTALTTKLMVSDADGDTVSVSMRSGPNWLSLATDGQLSGTPEMSDQGTDSLVVEASDGSLTTEATITIQVDFDAVEQALATGDLSLITDHSDEDMESVLLEIADPVLSLHREDIKTLYQLGADGTFEDASLAPNWSPPSLSRIPDSYNQAVALIPTPGVNSLAMMLQDGRVFAVKGRDESGARYLALGGNPTLAPDTTRNFSDSNDMDLFLRNALRWLANDETDEVLDIAITRAPQVYTGAVNAELGIRRWLESAFGDAVSFNGVETCQTHITPCLSDETDLIIVFRHAYNRETQLDGTNEPYNAITDAHKTGIGQLYIYNHVSPTIFSDRMLRRLKVTAGERLDRSQGEKVNGLASTLATYEYAQWGIPVIKSMVSRIVSDAFEYDFSACSGPLACAENSEIAIEIASLEEAVDAVLESVIARQSDPFSATETSRFQRALLLLGDYYRDQTSYPMRTDTTSAAEIYAALLGEFAVVLQRDNTPAQPDLGTYSGSNFPNSLLSDQTISLSSSQPFTSTGLYALPGVPVTLTRTDEEDATAWVQIQSLVSTHFEPFRSGEGGDFSRPIFVTSDRVELIKDQAVTVTSPYGGPIQIYANRWDQELSFSMSNVGQHPVWETADDTSSFLIDLASDTYNWAELITPGYVVHATTDKLREVLNTAPYQNDPERLAKDYESYLGDWPLWFEGYQGRHITDNSGLAAHSIADRYFPAVNRVRHLNIGASSCIDGCAGEIQQVESNIAPLSAQNQYLVAEEMHARLERTFAFREKTPQRTFGPQQAISDLSFFHSNYRRYSESGGLATTCPALPYQEIFSFIQAAQSSGDPAQTIREQTQFDEAAFNLVRYVQVTAALQAQGALTNGWELWPRLNLYERRYTRGGSTWGATVQDARVHSDGPRLGYGNRSAELVFDNTNFDDWMLVALSWSTGRDLTDYLTKLWGLETTELGREIVSNYGYDPISPVYYALLPTAHCTNLTAEALPIDGTTDWP
ncbi:MAG: ImpA family metalloprotease [Pseudomonadota bacterium]